MMYAGDELHDDEVTSGVTYQEVDPVLDALVRAPDCRRCGNPAIDHEELAGACPGETGWYAPLEAITEPELRALWGDR